MTRRQLIKIAQLEVAEWTKLPPGLAMAILFAFVHRVTEGERIEDTMARWSTKPAEIDFQI